MIDPEHDLPITKQAEVVRISRGSVYYRPRPMPESDLEIMRRLDRLHLEFPSTARGCCEACWWPRGGGARTAIERLYPHPLHQRPHVTTADLASRNRATRSTRICCASTAL